MSDVTRIENDRLSVDVAALGAEMQAIATRDGRQWLWNGDAAYWTGRSPVLFPIVGKAPDNRVEIDGRYYEMNQHGFARRSTFALAEHSAAHCRYVLDSSDATRAVYPFNFRLALTHSLDGATLIVTADVENRDRRPLPFGLGFHPAFVWPLPGAAGQPHAILLDNGGEPGLSRLDGGLRRKELLASPFEQGRLILDHGQYDEDAMIFPEGAGDSLRYGVEGGPMLAFRFQNLPNLALWTKPGAPFICIEPWHGTASVIGEGSDITKRPYAVSLGAGETARFSFSATFPI
jgi:galactose mutarotase-like enzyme